MKICQVFFGLNLNEDLPGVLFNDIIDGLSNDVTLGLKQVICNDIQGRKGDVEDFIYDELVGDKRVLYRDKRNKFIGEN